MISIFVNGKEYSGFTNARIVRSIETIASGFAISTSSTQSNALPITVNDQCRILADGITVIDGYVEAVSGDYGIDSHNITFSGRDKTGDVIDTSIGDISEFQPPISLSAVIQQTLGSVNITGIRVINEAGSIKQFEDYELVSAEIGQSCFEFFELYSRKRQVLLSTDGNGNIVLSRGSAERGPADLFNIIGGDKRNNIVSATFNYDFSNRYNKYTFRSQGNLSALGITESPKDATNKVGISFDRDIRVSRSLDVYSEESVDDDSAQERTKWEANIRRARSVTYSAVVQGHSVNGEAWKPNRVIHIKDDLAGIDSDMLIKEVTYNYNLDEGSTTVLSCTYPDAYRLQAEQDARTAKYNDIGNGIV